MEKQEILAIIENLEKDMQSPYFWNDKITAQAKIRELQELKDKLEGAAKYDKGPAIMTIFSGAGGDDAEDFTRMLLQMYLKFITNKGWDYRVLHKNQNDQDGYRNITIEIEGKDAYKTLKNESGVHRLVRVSPFNAKGARHTSFSMVEIIPKLEKIDNFSIPEDELRFEYSRSSGPGGQNVNKRETAVRVVHIPTNMAAESQAERSQESNREKALALLSGKLFRKAEEDRKRSEAGLYISKTTEIEWGNQIRSYVLHPYKMIKDHRTDLEVRDIESVLEDGQLDPFIEAEANL